MHQNCILDIEEKELDLKKLQERPGIVCYVVQRRYPVGHC